MSSSKRAVLREFYIRKYAALAATIIFILAILALFFWIYLRDYEVVDEITQTVTGEVVLHSRGGSRGEADPYFRVRLESGLIINVRDYGELPFNYSGVIVLNYGSGKTTGLGKYSINKEKTIETHNK